jgi:acetyl-CoA synthase
MSRYIATRAIRGANALVTEAEIMLRKALAEKGPDTPVAFPNTAYYLPLIFGMTGQKVETIGQLTPILEHARGLLHPVPSERHWTPYLGETLDSGMATLLAAETIEAIRFVYGLQPERLPGFTLAGGTAFTSPDGGNGNGAEGHLNGPIDDIQLRSWGIQLVDGRMPGFAAIVGAAKSNEVAVKIVRELQRRNILCFLSGNVNGRSIIHQLHEEGVELGYDTYTVPFGTDTISAIYALGFAVRSALTFGGMKGGMARDILMYNKERVFAFVLALGEVDDLKYAAAAGAINFGFPVIADTVIPEILPTGVTTYEHVVSMPFNEIEGKDDLERAERLVQKCIEVRGVKVRVADVPVPVPYGSAFEGEVVRKADMRIEFGGKYSRCFEYLRMVEMDAVTDGKVEVVGPDFAEIPPQGHMDMGIVVEVAGRQMQKDFEPVLERQIHYFVNGASGIQHIGQRDIAWIRISNAAADKGFKLEHFGKILHARFHADFGAIVDKVQVTIYTEPAQVQHWLERAREAYDFRNKRLADLTDNAVEEFYSCTLCVPPKQDVILPDGSFLPVEQLVEGAVDNGLRPVLSFAENHLTSRMMGELFINPAPEKLVRIALRNGNDLTLTANHKVLVDRLEGLTWVPAGKLEVGDAVLDVMPEFTPAKVEPPHIVDYLPDNYKVSDDEFYTQLSSWILARFGSLSEAARRLSITYQRLYSALYPAKHFSHQRLTLGEIKAILPAVGQSWEAIKGTLRRFQAGAVLNRTHLDTDILYAAGLVASDGCVRWRGPGGRSGVYVQFTNTTPALNARFAAIVSAVFDRPPTEQTYPPKVSQSGSLVIESRQDVTVSVAGNTLFGRLLNGLGIGLPGHEQKWTGYAISALSPDLVAAFLRGLFDGDGHVTGQRAFITTRSRLEARHIHLLLKKLGIASYISPITRGYQVATSSDGDTIRFRELVGSEHPDKYARLQAIQVRTDSRHVVRNDATPLDCGTQLAALLENYPVLVTRLAVDYKTLTAWISGERRPSKAKLAAVLDNLVEVIPAGDPNYMALRAWTQADVRFQKVEAVERVACESDRVYNFSVDETHNYVVNGVVVKNCQSFAPNHVCIVSPERLGLCGAYNWLDCKASYSINPTGPNQPIKLGKLIDPLKGYWDGTNSYAKIGSHGAVQEVAMYSIMENPMTACGCFECIVMLIPEANGVMVVSREDTSMTPAGMTFSTLAGMAGGGLQTPGVMGVGKYYLISPKFISADGGFKRVVWMSSVLKDTMADELKAVAMREGDPDLIEKIADERSATTVDELLAWLEEHNHPALVMDPIF